MHFSAILSVPCVLGEVEAESEDEDDDDDDCKKGSMDEVGILQVTAISSNPGYNGNRLFSNWGCPLVYDHVSKLCVSKINKAFAEGF